MNKLLKYSLFAGFAVAASPILGSTAEKTANPNIVLVFIDDMGCGDLSCYGATLYKTPNLDKLAAQGIRFTNFLSAQAVFSASRAGIMTGCYPNQDTFQQNKPMK